MHFREKISTTITTVTPEICCKNTSLKIEYLSHVCIATNGAHIEAYEKTVVAYSLLRHFIRLFVKNDFPKHRFELTSNSFKTPYIS